MDKLTPGVIWAAVLAAASAVVLLSNAAEKIVKAIKAAFVDGITYRQQAEQPEPKPSPEERLDALETTTDDMILLMTEMIGGE